MLTGEEAIVESKLDEIDIQLRFYEYLMACLEKKQIAESISKVTRIEKFRGEPRFVIAFEEAMMIKDKSLTEKELVGLNKIREYSLFNFYNTSLKTPYSFITQNVTLF